MDNQNSASVLLLALQERNIDTRNTINQLACVKGAVLSDRRIRELAQLNAEHIAQGDFFLD